MTTRQQIIRIAREYVGTPFHHAARVKGVGVDCVGLLACVGNEMDYPFTDVQSYARSPTGFAALVDHLAKHLDEVPVGQQQPGDVGVFWVDENTKLPQHACFFTERGMIHAWEHGGRRHVRGRRSGDSTQLGSVVEEYTFPPFWAKRLVKVFTLRGVDAWPH